MMTSKSHDGIIHFVSLARYAYPSLLPKMPSQRCCTQYCNRKPGGGREKPLWLGEREVKITIADARTRSQLRADAVREESDWMIRQQEYEFFCTLR